MTSAIAQFLEDEREKQTGDDLFYRRLPPIFELQVPARITNGSGTSFLFPLPMPPKSMSVDYPFAAEVTPTNQSGVVADQNGVLQVDILIQGTMGQRPKPYRGSYFGLIEPAERRLSSHDTASRSPPGTSLSGHRFLNHLRDSVFGLYSDLMQDPELADETRMILHLPKDDEHYVVVPRRFGRPRDRLVWDYEIELTGIEIAKAARDLPSEDKPLLAKLLDGIATVRSAIRLAQAAVRDLSELRSELEHVAQQVLGAVDDLSNVLNEVSDFVKGVKEMIPAGRARIEAVVQNLEGAIDNVGSALGDDAVHLLGEAVDAAQEILLHPQLFTPSPQAVVNSAFQRGLGLLTATSRSDLVTASTQTPPSSQRALRSAGTLPGDLVRDNRSRELPEEFRQYRSAWEVELGVEDSLDDLAALHLGDARRWRHIAILNSLQDPYVSEEGLPGTVGPGARILIPSTASPAQRRPNPAVLGARPEDSPRVRELGRDWLVSRDDKGQEDWVVDVDQGSTDLRVAEGVDCFAQDLVARIATPRGSDQIYRTFGTEGVVGFGEPDLEIDALRFRVAESVEADPRTAQGAQVTLRHQTVDTVGVTVKIAPRGLRSPVSVQASTPAPSGT